MTRNRKRVDHFNYCYRRSFIIVCIANMSAHENDDNNSDVWEFFSKVQNEENGLIVNYKCILCAKLYSPSNSTSTLRTHLKNKYSSYYKQPERRQLTLKEMHFKPYSLS